jgi:hypothetical protein
MMTAAVADWTFAAKRKSNMDWWQDGKSCRLLRSGAIVASAAITRTLIPERVSKPATSLHPATLSICMPGVFVGNIMKTVVWLAFLLFPPLSLADSLVSLNMDKNFGGIGNGFSGTQGTFVQTGVPPDPNGAVGDTQYVQMANSSFAVFDKATGGLIRGPILDTALWQGLDGPCESGSSIEQSGHSIGRGDPIVQYDKAAHRWVITAIANVRSGPSDRDPIVAGYECIAVSTTSDATGSYYLYPFQLPDGLGNDYPKFGIWPDAYYASFTLTNASSGATGGYACAFDRSRMLVGGLMRSKCFTQSTPPQGLKVNLPNVLLPADLDGTIPPPAGSPNYFMSLGEVSNGIYSLALYKFHVDFNKPSLSTLAGPFNVTVLPYSLTCSDNGVGCIPQPGTGQLLDSQGDRLMYRLAYRNFGDHAALVVNHTVAAGNSVAVRWYEIRNLNSITTSPGGNPTIYQQGTFAPDSTNRWIGSMAMDKFGNIAIGYSASSRTEYPSIRYTGRFVTDPLGTLEGEKVLMYGGASETTDGRWGDYASLSVDPVDDCTFWYTNEYFQEPGSTWSTRIGSFRFPNCPAHSSAVAAKLVPIMQLLLQ